MKEPIVEESSNISLIKALNWYHINKDKKDAMQYLKDYCNVKKIDLEKIKNINDSSLITTYCWLSRIVLNNKLDSEIYHKKILNYINDIKIEEPRKSVLKTYTKEEYDIEDFIGYLEECLDNFIMNRVEFDIEKEFTKKFVPQKFRTNVKEWAKTKQLEYTIEDSDEEKIEAYSNFSNRDRNKLLNILDTFLNIKKKTNKKISRKRKIDPAKRVSKMKYKQSDMILDINSISPVHIVESKIAILYNTKNCMLSVYKSSGIAGLDVRGSSIYNFNILIGKKRLKKPDESIKVFLKCKKEEIIEKFDSLPGTTYANNGFVNEHCLILRIEK